jgi:hypothetical protein
MLLGGIRPDHQDGTGEFCNIVHGIGHGTRAEGSGQTGHGAGVSKPGAVIDIVRPDHLAGEFIHQVIFFVGAFGGGQDTDGIRAK